jgi:hypothetical protein
MKICARCKIEKSGDGYYRDMTTPDGLSRYCKECRKNYNRTRYASQHTKSAKKNSWYLMLEDFERRLKELESEEKADR